MDISNPHATPADTIAALRTRYTGELAVADAASELTPQVFESLFTDGAEIDHDRWILCGPPDDDPDSINPGGDTLIECEYAEDAEFIAAARESVPRDARLKLAQLQWVERRVLSEDDLRSICLPDDEVDLTRHEDALSLLRLLAESAGEAVAW